MEAERIFEKYITHGAAMEVHIRPDVRRRLQGNVYHGESKADVFEEVQRELFDLMNSEFPRFLASEQCRECLQVCPSFCMPIRFILFSNLLNAAIGKRRALERSTLEIKHDR